MINNVTLIGRLTRDAELRYITETTSQQHNLILYAIEILKMQMARRMQTSSTA